MNWRYRLGSGLNVLAHKALAWRAVPLNRFVPRGTYLLYDVQRFAGTRTFKVIVDAGANVGQSAWGFTRYFPDSTIYCFEPGRAAFRGLTAAYGKHQAVRCLNLALGETTDTRRLAVPDDDTERATLVDVVDMVASSEQCSVVTLDEFCVSNAIEAIDLLKMDVQGWELAVLSGARDLLNSCLVRFIVAEIGFIESEKDITYFPRLHEHAQSYGFAFCGLYDTYRWGDTKQYVGFSNALYVNPKWRRK